MRLPIRELRAQQRKRNRETAQERSLQRARNCAPLPRCAYTASCSADTKQTYFGVPYQGWPLGHTAGASRGNREEVGQSFPPHA